MAFRPVRAGLLSAVILATCLATCAAADRDTRLAEAAQSGDMAAVRALLGAGKNADVNAPLGDGTTALHWVARADDLSTADLLIKAGADPKIANRHGVAPLELACVNGSAAMIAKLLDAGADANAANHSGQTALMIAARTGNPEAVKVLLDRGASVDSRDALAQQTALMFAVTEDHAEVVQLLLKHHADVNARTSIVETPPPTVGNLQGVGRAQNRAAPVPQGGMTPLLYAARDGRLEIARMLMAADASVNQAEANGSSPLLLAIINGHADVAKSLLDKNADPNATDGFGRAPLWSAVDVRNLDVADASGVNGIVREPFLPLIQALVERGANVNARTAKEPPSRRWMMPFGARQWVNPAGQTPFVRAALAGDVAVMRLLLEHGADPNIATFEGTTALMAASGVGWVSRQTYTESPESLVEAAKICIERHADVNAADSLGFTAMHGAANRGSDGIVQLLAANGAKLDIKDKKGRTPVEFAEGTVYVSGPPEKRPSTLALLQKLAGVDKAQ
jgi:ankyrin repeat protein